MPAPTRPSLHAGDNPVLVAVGLMFFVNGAVYANWIARLPEIQDRAGLSLGTLGLVLSAAGITGTLASVLAGRLIDTYGSRQVALGAALLVVATLPVVGAATSAWVLTATLLVLALADTLADMGMNVQAAQVDAARRRPVINRIHGVWSVGTLVGGGIAGAVADAGIGLLAHLGVVAIVLTGVLLVASRHLLPADPQVEEERLSDGRRRPLPTSLVLVLLSVGWFALAIEIVPAEWSTLRMSRDLGASSGLAALGFVAFVAGMVVGRLSGDTVMHRFGVRSVMLGGLAVSVTGSMVAATVEITGVVLLGFALAGLGTAVVYPTIYARATRIPGVKPGRSLGLMSAGLRIGVLLTPLVTGGIADRTSVGTAIAVVVLVCGGALLPGMIRLLRLT